jgi:hypothetical protein
VKHSLKGNCWTPSAIYDCRRCGSDFCDVCHKHDEPRGLCSVCPPCKACDKDTGVSAAPPRPATAGQDDKE